MKNISKLKKHIVFGSKENFLDKCYSYISFNSNGNIHYQIQELVKKYINKNYNWKDESNIGKDNLIYQALFNALPTMTNSDLQLLKTILCI